MIFRLQYFSFLVSKHHITFSIKLCETLKAKILHQLGSMLNLSGCVSTTNTHEYVTSLNFWGSYIPKKKKVSSPVKPLKCRHGHAVMAKLCPQPSEPDPWPPAQKERVQLWESVLSLSPGSTRILQGSEI